MLKRRWVRISLAVLGVVVLLGLFFGGAAWGYGRGYGEGYGQGLKAQLPAKPAVVTPSPTPTTTPIPNNVPNTTPVPQQPSSVIVTVNPPVVNVTVSQTVNDGDKSDSQASSQTTSYGSAGIGFEELKGLVYNGNFNEYKGILEDGSNLDHTWWSGGPFGLTRFSVKWRGSVVVEESGRYRFTVLGDDRVRLEVDDQAVIDKWVSGQPATEYAVDLDLTAGAHKIVLKYFNDIVGDSRIKLSCQRIY